ncbi:MAG: pilus assembly protein TadG-related protein, partial [Acidobacteria bacterium]|nr:pilus assembly protein TadG-related protein [Acidobacteriota bacterium]
MKSRESTERGVSLVIVAAGLTAFLGFLAIVLDLGMLYAARSDAQKAADAASLAGAKYFLDQGSLPTTLTTPMLNESKAYAKAIGAQNAIRGGNVQPSE